MQQHSRLDPIDFGAAALRLRAHRHEILSGNIANADTPNYKAVDFDFAAALQKELSGQARLGSTLLRTHERHFPGQSVTSSAELMFRIPVQPSVDGNTVDPDLERSQFVKNAMMTEATISFLSGAIKSRLSAITGQAS